MPHEWPNVRTRRMSLICGFGSMREEGRAGRGGGCLKTQHARSNDSREQAEIVRDFKRPADVGAEVVAHDDDKLVLAAERGVSWG